MRLRAPHARGLAALAVVVAGAATVLQANAQEPGLKIGDVVNAFNVYDVTGPNKGNELCYR